MKFDFDKKTQEMVKALVLAGTLLMLVFYAVSKLDFVFLILGQFIEILLPFVFGFAIAFVAVPICNKIQHQWLRKTKLKVRTKRRIAAIASVVFLVLLIFIVLAIIVPQITNSVIMLSQNVTLYMDDIDKVLENASDSQIIRDIVSFIWSYSEEVVTFIVDALKGSLPQIVNYSVGFIKMLINFFIGVFIAVYVMFDKERFSTQAKKVGYALFPKKQVDSAVEVGRLTTKMFNAFIVGKTIDSLIIGIICFIGMVLMKMEYSLLISVIIGVTNMIPIFGPFIGAIPGFLILFILNPAQALVFLIWILILQQFDGNILGPYILGDSVGLPSFWVMFSIIVGGGFFGVVGMFLGVPMFAVVYILVKNIVDRRLKEKGIVVEQ
ncbi:MAG: AI-2E family transporter [Anaerorhabdus sp.]